MFANLFYLYVFAEVSQIQELFPVLAKVHFQKLLILLLLAGIVSNPEYRKQLWDRIQAPQAKVLVLMSFWMVFSVPFSVYPGGSFAFLTQYYWKLLVSFLIVITYVVSNEDVDKTIWAYVMGAGVMSLFAFTSTGEGRLDFLDSQDANEMAAHLCVAFPFAFWRVWEIGKFKTIVAFIVCVLMVIVVIKTQSRGAFLGIVSLALLFVTQIKLLKGKFPVKGIVVTVIIGVFLTLNYVSTEYISRISTMLNYEDDYNVRSDSGRIAVWTRGLKMIAHSPVTGVGINSFISADGLYNDGDGKWSAAHNSFLQVGAELGIPGLGMFLYLIIATINRLREIINKYPSSCHVTLSKLNAFSLIGGFIAFCVTGFFLSLAFGSTFFFILALATSFISTQNEELKKMNINFN